MKEGLQIVLLKQLRRSLVLTLKINPSQVFNASKDAERVDKRENTCAS